ncbi:MAG: DUF6502 family protein [Gammaproteobacteria bacterium]
MTDRQEVLIEAAGEIVGALARLLLENGVTFATFNELAKSVFVEVVEQEFVLGERKLSHARIATITGIPRKEVSRLRKLDPKLDRDEVLERNRAARVLSAWVREPEYQDRKGDPVPLPLEGTPSFSGLVRRHSGDIPPRAIADELIRVGAVEFTDGRYVLLSKAYQPAHGQTEILEMLGTDARQLIDTLRHNFHREEGEPGRFHAKVQYDRVPVEYVEAFRQLSRRMARNLLFELDRWLSEHDRDHNPDVLGTGETALGLAVFEVEETRRGAGEEDDSS